ncbi:hypothetical protein Q0F99_04940 [Rathayibacter oskolensis]|nr:hypothetical protein [Rathayibacter oskolensis]WKK72335.1 hypothetical protein Q0F99_04940 [Rathayibacter oskolensis]
MTGLLIPDGAPTVVGVAEPLPPKQTDAGRSPPAGSAACSATRS